ncbi:MAG: hypothetical protein L0H54_14375, partial [Alcaligenaceae bacterium]|nr:hypothetical protein [Alcaligenaceae bacterium]
PNDMQACAMCQFFIPLEGQPGSGMMDEQQGNMMGSGMMGGRGGNMMADGTCQRVEGSISPMGWCALYQPISR